MTRIKERLTRVSGIGFALVMTLALSAGPLLAECQNRNGSGRNCTPSENARQCIADADDARDQCLSNSQGGLARGGCHIGRRIDGVGCAVGLIGDTVGEVLSE